MHGPGQRGRTAALVVVCGVWLAGCAATPAPGPVVSTPPAATPTSPIAVPADGVLLRSLGLVNGPVDTFSLPRTTVLSAIVDQPGSVSVVISEPSAGQVYAYLERSLPAAGFTVTAQAATTQTLTFSGRGWRGSFTGDTRACAVLLRPV